MSRNTPHPSAKPLLLYDGECGLCQIVSRFVSRRSSQIQVEPLQSKHAQNLLAQLGLPQKDFDSLVFVPDLTHSENRHYLRTDGVIAILRLLDPPWCWFTFLKIVPSAWRDSAYRFVARNRHRFFRRTQN